MRSSQTKRFQVHNAILTMEKYATQEGALTLCMRWLLVWECALVDDVLATALQRFGTHHTVSGAV